jgi:actin-related protein 8, plant
MFSTVFQGRVMYKNCVETVGLDALKLTGFFKTLMQRRNISCESLYTIRAIKEVKFVYVASLKLVGVHTFF